MVMSHLAYSAIIMAFWRGMAMMLTCGRSAGTISGDRNQAEQFIALFFLKPHEFDLSPVTEYTKAVLTALAALKHRAEGEH